VSSGTRDLYFGAGDGVRVRRGGKNGVGVGVSDGVGDQDGVGVKVGVGVQVGDGVQVGV
jgi:hypothetical protein